MFALEPRLVFDLHSHLGTSYLDLCSLITISDHLVLITLEESTKTLETIHIAAIAAPSNLDSIFMCRALSTSRQFSNRTA